MVKKIIKKKGDVSIFDRIPADLIGQICLYLKQKEVYIVCCNLSKVWYNFILNKINTDIPNQYCCSSLNIYQHNYVQQLLPLSDLEKMATLKTFLAKVRFDNLTTLSLHNFKSPDVIFMEISHKVSNNFTLKLDECNIDDNLLELLPLKLSKLLIYSTSDINNFKFKDTPNTRITNFSKNLKSLHLSLFKHYDILSYLHSLSSLEELNIEVSRRFINGGYNSSYSSISTDNSEKIINFIQSLNALKTINIKNLDANKLTLNLPAKVETYSFENCEFKSLTLPESLLSFQNDNNMCKDYKVVSNLLNLKSISISNYSNSASHTFTNSVLNLNFLNSSFMTNLKVIQLKNLRISYDNLMIPENVEDLEISGKEIKIKSLVFYSNNCIKKIKFYFSEIQYFLDHYLNPFLFQNCRSLSSVDIDNFKFNKDSFYYPGSVNDFKILNSSLKDITCYSAHDHEFYFTTSKFVVSNYLLNFDASHNSISSVDLSKTILQSINLSYNIELNYIVLCRSLKKLIVSNCKLKNLPDLPVNLEILDCSYNIITVYPIFPDSLIDLNIYGNDSQYFHNFPKYIQNFTSSIKFTFLSLLRFGQIPCTIKKLNNINGDKFELINKLLSSLSMLQNRDSVKFKNNCQSSFNNISAVLNSMKAVKKFKACFREDERLLKELELESCILTLLIDYKS